MPVLTGTSGAGDAAWSTTITDNLGLEGTITVGALLVPDGTVAVVTNVTPPTLGSGQSGRIYRVDTSGGVTTIALPVGVVGQKYTFVLSDASNDLVVNCDAVTSAMLGAVSIMDDEGTTNSRSAAANGSTHDRCLIDVSAGTVVAGTYVTFTCLVGGAGTSLWFVEGTCITGDGAQAAVVFSSN